MFSATKAMKIDAYLSRGTGVTRAERSGKCNHGQDNRKGPHIALPWPIISSNPANDIEGEREEEGPC